MTHAAFGTSRAAAMVLPYGVLVAVLAIARGRPVRILAVISAMPISTWWQALRDLAQRGQIAVCARAGRSCGCRARSWAPSSASASASPAPPCRA